MEHDLDADSFLNRNVGSLLLPDFIEKLRRRSPLCASGDGAPENVDVVGINLDGLRRPGSADIKLIAIDCFRRTGIEVQENVVDRPALGTKTGGAIAVGEGSKIRRDDSPVG